MRAEKIIGAITILHSGHMEIREETIVYNDDETVLTRVNHRRVMTPDDDFSNEPEDVQQAALIVKIPARVQRWAVFKDGQVKPIKESIPVAPVVKAEIDGMADRPE